MLNGMDLEDRLNKAAQNIATQIKQNRRVKLGVWQSIMDRRAAHADPESHNVQALQVDDQDEEEQD